MEFSKLVREGQKMKFTFIFLFLSYSACPALADSYAQLNANVRQYKTRVEDRRAHIKELAEKKAELHEQEAIRAILDEMITDANDLKENFVKFQREKKKLMYEHPQQGDATERQYRRFEIETIEEINTISNIDLRLKGILMKIGKTYAKAPEVVAKENAKQAKEEKREEPQQKSHTPKTEPATSTRPKLTY